MAILGGSSTSVIWFQRFVRFYGRRDALKAMFGVQGDPKMLSPTGNEEPKNHVKGLIDRIGGILPTTAGGTETGDRSNTGQSYFTYQESAIFPSIADIDNRVSLIGQDSSNAYVKTENCLIVRPLKIDDVAHGQEVQYESISGKVVSDVPTGFYKVTPRQIDYPVDQEFNDGASVSRFIQLIALNKVEYDCYFYGFSETGIFIKGYRWCNVSTSTKDGGEGHDLSSREQTKYMVEATPRTIDAFSLREEDRFFTEQLYSNVLDDTK